MANNIHAMVRITGASGAIVDRSGAVFGVVRNGAGDYTLQMSQGIDATERHVAVNQIHAGIRGGFSVEEVDDNNVRVRVTDAAGAAADPAQCRIVVQRTQRLAF